MTRWLRAAWRGLLRLPTKPAQTSSRTTWSRLTRPAGRSALHVFSSPRPLRRIATIDLETWVSFNHPMKPGDCLGYLKPLFRLSKLEEAQASYDTALRNSEDYYFAGHLLASGARMSYVADTGYFYQRSPASTSHRLQPAQTKAWLDAESRFRKRFDAALSPTEIAALDQRGRFLRDVDQFVAAIDAMKERKIGALCGLLASDLRASAFTLSTLAKIARGKSAEAKASLRRAVWPAA